MNFFFFGAELFLLTNSIFFGTFQIIDLTHLQIVVDLIQEHLLFNGKVRIL